jgi:TetR/AcrR family fatty acid metabolism transcriptional regulator
VSLDPHKREKILESAVREFARHGFKKASIESIAEAAGVGKGTIYLAAETKEDLFYQAVHREVRAWVAECGRHIDPARTAEELMIECAAAGFAYLQERPLVKDLLFGTHNMVLQEFPDRLEQLQQIGLANTVEILQIGVRQGRFRAELDLRAVARIIEDFMLASHVFHRQENQADKFHERLRIALDLLLNGIRVRSLGG